MHRKSLEAAEHLKEDGCNSDHEETTSMRTDTSDTSVTSGQQQSTAATTAGQQPPGGHSNGPLPPIPHQPPQQPPPPQQQDKDQHQQQQLQAARTQQPPHYPPAEDPEAFRNNSIACLRAKAQEHSAKLLNHGLMLQVRSLSNLTHTQPPGCDANANNLQHHPDIVNSDTSSSMF